jgi:glycosyltransferase involved in cell wall biosynthesis
MKIIHIITGLGGGGAENLLLDIATQLYLHGGVEQKVIYYTPVDLLASQFEAMGIETVYIDQKALGTFRSVLATRRVIRSFKPDLVHTNLMRADIIGRSAALSIRGQKCISTIHNMDAWRAEHSFFGYSLSVFDKITLNMNRRTHLVAVSDSCRIWCIARTKIRPGKIDTLRNFTGSRSEKKVGWVPRASLGIDESDLLLINVARMVPTKAQMDIVKVASFLKELGISNIKFLILGRGEQERNLKEEIEKRNVSDLVTMPGFVRNIYDYYEISDAFLLPSIVEGMPITMLEAFTNGLPAVVSDIPSTREMIEQGAGAISFPLHDIEYLAAMLLSIRAGGIDLRALAEKNHTYLKELTPEKYVQKLLEIYGAMGVSIP